MQRRLMTIEEFGKWAEKLKFLTLFGTKKDKFYIFFKYLEEKELICPLKVARQGSYFGGQMRTERGAIFFRNSPEDYFKKVEHYYHPFQFFQFIIYYDYYTKASYINSEYHYFFQIKWIETHIEDEGEKKKKIEKVNKEYETWIRTTNKKMYKGFNKTIDNHSNESSKVKKQKKKKNIRDMKNANKEKNTLKDFFLSNLMHRYWLSPEYLKVWIKIDSLMHFREYLITPTLVDVSHREVGVSIFDKYKRDEVFSEFLEWRELKIENIGQFLTELEFETLKEFYSRIYYDLIHNNKLNELDQWRDLFDLIPRSKKKELMKFLNVSLNILSILRFLTRFTWEFFQYNLEPWPKNKEHEKPYFCFSEPSEVLDFRKSVLSDFSLFVSVPFILYVEGATEKSILKPYVREKSWLRYKVKNIKGLSKTIYHLKLSKDIEGQVYYFFLDYESPGDYEGKKGEVGDNGAFFFPDFVTENFLPEEILISFKNWLKNCNITLSASLEEELLDLLENAKQDSIRLISQAVKTENPKGYEDILIGFLMRNFQQELLNADPDLRNNPMATSVDKKKLKPKFKESFTENHLTPLVEESLKNDPEGSTRKFSFELKLQPFYSKIDKFRLRNQKIQYDLQVP